MASIERNSVSVLLFFYDHVRQTQGWCCYLFSALLERGKQLLFPLIMVPLPWPTGPTPSTLCSWRTSTRWLSGVQSVARGLKLWETKWSHGIFYVGLDALEQFFSARGNFVSQGMIENVWRPVWLSYLGGRRCCWHPVCRDQGSRKCPTVHTTVPPTKNAPTPVVRGAEVEKPCLRARGSFDRWKSGG